MEIKRDEMFHFVRWVNLVIGLSNMYYYFMGAGLPVLALGFLNIAVWSFTRKVKKSNV
jgi:hypothetical protein|tara:strand:+ start:206 stop:379 length:174 start_codon:yes stop_codon:yes gene_type:complete